MKSQALKICLAGLTLVSFASANAQRSFTQPAGFQRFRELAYRGFDMVDASGKPISPQTKMELSNGRVVTAQEFYDSLNRIEKGLNKMGHSLREGPAPIVLTGNYADRAVFQSQISDYTKSFKTSIADPRPPRRAPTHSGWQPGQLRQTSTGKAGTMSTYGQAATSEVSKILSQGTTLGNDAKTHYEWGFDKKFGDTSLGARLQAGLTVNAQSLNSANPPSMKGSTTTIEAIFKGGCQGTLLGNPFDILDGTCRVGTSSATGKVSVGWALSIAGYQVIADNKSYDASFSWNDGYSIPFQKQSETIEFPIFGPFACSGFIGIQGEAGIKANLALNPIYAEAEVVPYVKAGVYGEVDAGLDLEVASAWGGLHADLVLVDDQFTLGANLGIVAIPGNKIGWRDELYVQNNLSLFTGNLSLVAHVFGPGGVKLQDFTYPFYTVPGYRDNRTLYQVGSTNALPWVGN